MAEINYPKLMAWMVIVLMPDMVEAGSAHRSATKLETCPRDSAPGAWGAVHAHPPERIGYRVCVTVSTPIPEAPKTIVNLHTFLEITDQSGTQHLGPAT